MVANGQGPGAVAPIGDFLRYHSNTAAVGVVSAVAVGAVGSHEKRTISSRASCDSTVPETGIYKRVRTYKHGQYVSLEF